MLEAHGLHYTYPGGTSGLAGIDLSIAAGERLAILGANGAGKSTLMRILSGGLLPDSGAIALEGTPVAGDRAGAMRLRRAVGLVLQDPDDQLFAASVMEDISFGPLNLGLDEAAARRRVLEALEALDIASLAERPTHLLSFGQRKRVALAGVLAMQPRLLLLDEPTAGLDPLGVEQLMVSLAGISRRGTAIAIATHDMDLAFAWADRIVIFAAGKVAAIGSPDTVFVDAKRLAELAMKPPSIWTLSQALRERGLLDASAPTPRTPAELLARF
jgi:cobalt/nickel transport system ATP-binding protein